MRNALNFDACQVFITSVKTNSQERAGKMIWICCTFTEKIEVKEFSCAFKTWKEQNHPKERGEENTFKTIPDDKLIL